MSTTRDYEEIVGFIAGGTDPAGVASFHPSAETVARVAELLDAEKAGVAIPEDVSELDHFLQAGACDAPGQGAGTATHGS